MNFIVKFHSLFVSNDSKNVEVYFHKRVLVKQMFSKIKLFWTCISGGRLCIILQIFLCFAYALPIALLTYTRFRKDRTLLSINTKAKEQNLRFKTSTQ